MLEPGFLVAVCRSSTGKRQFLVTCHIHYGTYGLKMFTKSQSYYSCGGALWFGCSLVSRSSAWQSDDYCAVLQAMFKLAQGEYVAAEKIENVISRSQFVAQAFVYGDSLQSKLVAIIIPDFEVLQPWAAQRKLPSDTGELCKSSAVKQAVFRSITEEGRTAKLRGFEQVGAYFTTRTDAMCCSILMSLTCRQTPLN